MRLLFTVQFTGNWGTLEDNKVPTTEEGFYGSKDMTVDIDCDMGKMFYRNCSCTYRELQRASIPHFHRLDASCLLCGPQCPCLLL